MIPDKTLPKWHGLVAKAWAVITLIAGVYVLIEVSTEVMLPLPGHVIGVLVVVDTLVCALFAIDFAFGLATSKNRHAYFKGNWLNLVSAIPFSIVCRSLRIIAIARLVRLSALIRILSGIKGVNRIAIHLRSNVAERVVVQYAGVLCLVCYYCSLAFYAVEKGANANVHNFGDSLWWCFTTVTTIGYGDIYPVTIAGRLVAVVLALSGMGLFALITGLISARFVHVSQKASLDRDLV